MKRKQLITMIWVLSLVLLCLVALAGIRSLPPKDPILQTESTETQAPTTETTAPPTTEPTVPPTTAPPVVKETTATLGATGDMLIHKPILTACYDSAADRYDFGSIFTYFGPYLAQLDYAAANLEVTLCGEDNGYEYKGYPNFNCPDAIAQNLRDSGVDLLLTANNHSYDTRSVGFHRTQSVLADLGLDHIGTRPDTNTPNYLVQDVGGIQVGTICYTYNTGVAADGSVSLNTIPLSAEDSALVNTFSYEDLDGFYAKLQGELAAMEADGAEATVLFIHWGYEYHLTPSADQTAMAQALCDLGIDVIIGGHPTWCSPWSC